MRRNPRLFQHPDMFSEKETSAFAPLESLSREELVRIPFENFSKEELDDIAEDDYDLYEEILRSSGAEERRDEIIKEIENFAENLAESEKEYHASQGGGEWVVDQFQSWLEYEADFDELLDFVSEQLGDDLSELPEDQLEEILRDPYIYEIRAEADANKYNTYSVWQVFEAEAETQLEDYEGSFGSEFFNLLRALKPYFEMEDTVRLTRDALARADVYTDISFLFDMVENPNRHGERYGGLSANLTVSVDVMHYPDLNVEELQERLAGLAKSEKRIKRDESEQNIVYQFDDGDYVADLRSEQLRTEGRMQRHCVGRPGMGYARRVQDGDIKIFSLRTPNAKAILTIEVTLDRQGRPTKIPQVLGFTNRLPGFESGRGHSEVTKPEEIRKVAEFIREYLRLDPYESRHLLPALEVVEGGRGGARANPGGLPVPPRLQRLADSLHAQAVARMREPRRNPEQSRVKSLQSALKQATADLDAYLAEEDYRGYSIFFDKVITNALGGHVGLNADWVNKAWPLDGNLFLFAEDDFGEYVIVRRQVIDDEYLDEEVLVDGRPAYATDHYSLIKLLGKSFS